MSDSRDRLAPGQSRVSTVSAFGRIGFLLAAAVLTIPRAPVVVATLDPPALADPLQAMVAPQRLACLVADHTSARCESGNSGSGPRHGLTRHRVSQGAR